MILFRLRKIVVLREIGIKVFIFGDDFYLVDVVI